jgi:hypothetical protein
VEQNGKCAAFVYLIAEIGKIRSKLQRGRSTMTQRSSVTAPSTAKNSSLSITRGSRSPAVELLQVLRTRHQAFQQDLVLARNWVENKLESEPDCSTDLLADESLPAWLRAELQWPDDSVAAPAKRVELAYRATQWLWRRRAGLLSETQALLNTPTNHDGTEIAVALPRVFFYLILLGDRAWNTFIGGKREDAAIRSVYGPGSVQVRARRHYAWELKPCSGDEALEYCANIQVAAQAGLAPRGKLVGINYQHMISTVWSPNASIKAIVAAFEKRLQNSGYKPVPTIPERRRKNSVDFDRYFEQYLLLCRFEQYNETATIKDLAQALADGKEIPGLEVDDERTWHKGMRPRNRGSLQNSLGAAKRLFGVIDDTPLPV